MRITALLLALSVAGLVAAQPSAIDLGTLTANASTNGNIAATAQVDWYKFTIGTVPYLDITTNGSSTLSDSEIGLYSATGAMIANNDDDGLGLLSTLSFGTGSHLTLGDSWNLGGNGIAEGENGPLGAGTYYLAVAGYDATFNATNWSVIGGSSKGLYLVTFYTTPEPASALLLALGCLVLRRR
jgi:hypothetical protein